jgi:hypothetical protein
MQVGTIKRKTMPEQLSAHSFTGVGGRCIHCGAAPISVGSVEERSCVKRDIRETDLRPEPVRRVPVTEEFDAIHQRLQELRKEAANRDTVAAIDNSMYC